MKGKLIAAALVACTMSMGQAFGAARGDDIALKNYRSELLKMKAKDVRAIISDLQVEVSENCGIPLEYLRRDGAAVNQPDDTQEHDFQTLSETLTCFEANVRLFIANLVMVHKMRDSSMDFYRKHSTISDRGNRVGPGAGMDERHEAPTPIVREGNGSPQPIIDSKKSGGFIIDRTGGVDVKTTRKGGMLIIERN